MTVRGVDPLVAVTYKSAIDDPHRIVKSKAAGALFGLTPKKYQSGEKDVTGGITLAGDETVRTVLYEAANVLLSRTRELPYRPAAPSLHQRPDRWQHPTTCRPSSKTACILRGVHR